MTAEPDTFVVIWRLAPRSRWQVQPFIHGASEGDQVGQKLVRQFGGEAWVCPVEVPEREQVSRDMEDEG